MGEFLEYFDVGVEHGTRTCKVNRECAAEALSHETMKDEYFESHFFFSSLFVEPPFHALGGAIRGVTCILTTHGHVAMSRAANNKLLFVFFEEVGHAARFYLTPIV